MDVSNKIKVLHYLNAGYPALWVKTQELERAETNIVDEIQQWDNHRNTRITLYRWDCLARLPGPERCARKPTARPLPAQDPGKTLQPNPEWTFPLD